MARYIDADALIEHLEDNLRECGNPDMDTEPITYGCVLGLKGALSYAETLPTADVVEVVRCKDCKHSSYLYSCEKYMCKKGHGATKGEDEFCSFGERKGGKHYDL